MRRRAVRRHREDPWKARGWLTGGAEARIAGALGGVLLLAAAVTGIGAAEEWQYARYENERYAEATGSVRANPEGEPEVVLEVRGQGTFHAPAWAAADFEIGAPVRVLVGRRDTTDFMLWEDRAEPAPYALAVLVLLGAAGACAGVAWVLVRRGRLDASHALDAAAEPVEPDRPAKGAVPGSVTEVPPRAGPGYLLAAAAGAVAVLAIPTGIPAPEYGTATGTVMVDTHGRYGVTYYDPRWQTTWDRPLTDAEARGRRVGDTMPVHYVLGEDDGYLQEPNPPNLLLGTAWIAVAVGRRLRWRVTLRRAASTRPEPVPYVGWVRVQWGTTWLALAPYDATSVRDVRLVPLHDTVPVPEAVQGILWTRGRLRAGGSVVVHTRAGDAMWPVGRVRGPLTAALLGPSPWAPEPPRGRHAWFLPARPGAAQRGA